MLKKPNAQYSLAQPESLAVQIAARVRSRMFALFMSKFRPSELDEVLDLGVTTDQSFASSNYFEALYPYKNKITAGGLTDASFLEKVYPGVRFKLANALDLPFSSDSFDYVHSSAVLEHVGSSKNQARMISECLRVARKGICLTTPNPWFPIEFHTQLPLVHWLPKSWFRRFLVLIGQPDLAMEANLNLVTEYELRRMLIHHSDWSFDFSSARLFGWKSNIVLFARKNGEGQSTQQTT